LVEDLLFCLQISRAAVTKRFFA